MLTFVFCIINSLQDEDEEEYGSDDEVLPKDLTSQDELRAACSQVRSTGKRAPAKLTNMQIGIVEKLIAKYGDDTKAMTRDRKLNAMQHTESVRAQRAHPWIFRP